MSFISRFQTAPRLATSAVAAAARQQQRGFARLSLTGRLGRQPEILASQTGRELVVFHVASSNNSRDREAPPSWFRVLSFAEGPRKDFMLSLPKGYVYRVITKIELSSFPPVFYRANC